MPFREVISTDGVGVATAGVGGLRGSASGDAVLNLSGVVGTVEAAYLVWHGQVDLRIMLLGVTSFDAGDLLL
ncbi:MAG: hypothetical protein AAGE18_06515 [Pseudomonadota bacterium]